ncbi:ABC transporter ATP-binding protein [Rhodococcus sp. NCIMB 12038]|uniref:ABC transporter ATP-binding protein n=1 Tax=Rhodococcus sp. NCIMB 12038 TaxID=933800 RepID=UPI000B3CE7DF|nr:ABC transporter ATP-binding protein [Rhodococcus sp. NCIMB 12038]OUS92114.1 hypothetical protein CA951_29845 [Rhodococcus sp. NCIMB 12038]
MAASLESGGLELVDVTAGYGDAMALKGASLSVGHRQITAILGANGAGKSTVLRTITGQVKLRKGQLRFDGEDLAGLRPDQTLARGIAHVLEGRQVFSTMTVLENLELGATARGRSTRQESIDMLFDRFPILAEKAAQPAGQLSGGQQQMVAISRAFMSRPRLLLLDEPSLGLAPVMLPVVVDLIRWAQSVLGASILLVEQYTSMALEVASTGYVLKNGHIVLTGTSEELQEGDALQNAYLSHASTDGTTDQTEITTAMEAS